MDGMGKRSICISESNTYRIFLIPGPGSFWDFCEEVQLFKIKKTIVLDTSNSGIPSPLFPPNIPHPQKARIFLFFTPVAL